MSVMCLWKYRGESTSEKNQKGYVFVMDYLAQWELFFKLRQNKWQQMASARERQVLMSKYTV